MGGVGMAPAPHRLCSNRNPHWEEQGTDLRANIILEFSPSGDTCAQRLPRPVGNPRKATEMAIASYVMPNFWRRRIDVTCGACAFPGQIGPPEFYAMIDVMFSSLW